MIKFGYKLLLMLNNLLKMTNFVLDPLKISENNSNLWNSLAINNTK